MGRRSRRERKLAKAAKRLPPGAVSRDLDPSLAPARPPTGYAPQKPPGKVSDGGPASQFFGPLEPIFPTAPPEVRGRRFDFEPGENLQLRPRAHEGVGFRELRALAEAYDVLRLVIETRKDQMERLTWTVRPKVDAKGEPAAGQDSAIAEITDLLEAPDRRQPWGSWLRTLLEDMFVIDAATLYVRPTRGGKIYALEPIDGALIKRVIDDWGRTPYPPAPAYQHILHGLPALDYTTDEIIYAPRNIRSNKLYGYSHVEQIVTIVNIALRRELFFLNYYTEGNVPEALVGVPTNWTPKQVQEFQDFFDALMRGDLAARRRIKFVPGEMAKNVWQTKEAAFVNEADDWLARVVCYCLSVPPTPFIKQMNRATAESAHDAALEEGLVPVMNWVARLINWDVIRRGWPGAKVEFAWDDDREVDQATAATVDVQYVTNGIKTINEVRDRLGLDPDPEGDKLLVKAGSGYAPVGDPMPAEPGGPPGPGQAPHGAPPAEHPPAAPPPKAGQEAQPAAKRAGAPFRKGYWSRHAPGPADAPASGRHGD